MTQLRSRIKRLERAVAPAPQMPDPEEARRQLDEKIRALLEKVRDPSYTPEPVDRSTWSPIKRKLAERIDRIRRAKEQEARLRAQGLIP